MTWPPGFAPGETDLYIRESLGISAPTAVAWAWLIRPRLWPTYYPHCARMDVPGDGILSLGTEFRWRTLGTPVVTRVDEFVPDRRIAWWGAGGGTEAYHSFDIVPDGAGCIVISSETQMGMLPRLLRPLMRPLFGRVHRNWLTGLKRVAEAGPPAD